jgi:cardiolipin synthase
MLHAKLILVDQSHALLGSANLDLRSLFLNFEIGWLHTSPSDIQAFQDWNRAIIADCISYSDATKDKSKLPSKLTQHFVRLLEPLL